MAKTFGATSTTDDVLSGKDLSGKRILVTGVSAGLGVETARALAAHGAEVIGTARDLDKAKRATAENKGKLKLIELDLASFASARKASDELNKQGQQLDLVIANAGVMATPAGKTADGFETQFGTNHLGHFLFINRIAPLLRANSRLVNLSSSAHRMSDVSLDDPNFETTEYDPWIAYGRSKTANVLFAVEFDRRHKARGIRATAVHPGGIRTELMRHIDEGVMTARMEAIRATMEKAGRSFAFKTIPQGAATSVWAGVTAHADDVGGRYCENCHVAETITGTPENDLSEGVRAYALDAERAKTLWTNSETWVGEKFS